MRLILLSVLLFNWACSDRGLKKDEIVVYLDDFSPDNKGRIHANSAFRLAFEKLQDNGGGTLIIPSGTFLLSEHFEPPANIKILGEGPSTVLKVGDANGNPFSIPYGGLFSFVGVHNITIDSVSFDLNAPKNYRTLMQFRNCKNITVRSCNFYNSNQSNADHSWTLHGIEARNIDGFQLLNNSSVGCQFKLCGANASANNVLARGNRMENCTQMGISVVAIPLKSDTCTISNIDISDNYFHNIDDDPVYVGFDKGVRMTEGKLIIRNIKVSDNKMYDSGHIDPSSWFGILIRGTEDTDSILIENNLISNQRAGKFSYGIAVLYAGSDQGFMTNIAILNNRIFTADHGAITIAKARKSKIVDNICQNTGRGIEVLGSRDILVRNNLTQNNGMGLHIVNSLDVHVNKNELLENRTALMLEALAQNDSIQIFSSDNSISHKAGSGSAVISKGKGIFDEQYKRNRIKGYSRDFESVDKPTSRRRLVDDKIK